jgi:endonuclease-3 related protein
MDVEELHRRLAENYDVVGWWPAESPWEVMVGAILTQQTTWESVARVLGEMKKREALSVQAIDRLEPAELEAMVRPTGFYRQKARNVKALASYISRNYGGDPVGLLSKDAGEARRELLSLPGIGNETADAILLFAGKRPQFIAAVYVSRVLRRLDIFDSEDYHEVQRFVESSLPPDPREYAQLYALLVQHARTTCRSRPRCASCFLRARCRFSE